MQSGGWSRSVIVSMCTCRVPVSSSRLLLLMSSWEVRIRERWRHRLISASLLEQWLLTSNLNHMTPPSSSSAAHCRFKGLPGWFIGGHREDLRGRWELEDESEAWRLPAGLSSPPQVHHWQPCPHINIYTRCLQQTSCCFHITGLNKWIFDVLFYLFQSFVWKATETNFGNEDVWCETDALLQYITV